MEQCEDSALHPALGDFHFKYVAEEELLRIVRKVRREKQKERDAQRWERFVKAKQKTVESEPKECKYEKTAVAPDPSYQHCGQVMKTVPNLIKEVPKKSRSETGSEHISLSSEVEVLLPMKQSIPTDSVMTVRETGSLQRIAFLRHRIGLALDSITGMIHCRPSEPDGPDDLERRKIRINGFLSRFSRNYLFQFQRQVTDLRRQMICASPETPGRHTEYQALMQKLVSAHQTAVQSLQAYLSQIPASLQGTNIFGKLQDLLHHLCDLSSLKYQLDIHGGVIDGCENVEDTDEIYVKCKELLGLLQEKRFEVEEISVSAGASSPPSARGCLNPRSQQVSNASHRSIHHGSWKKNSVHLARAKFGVPSSNRSSVSARLSSRERQLNQGRPVKDTPANSCCNIELQEMISHMHDVLCNKLVAKKKKRGKERCKNFHETNGINRVGHLKHQTEVQNLSKNVQLVLTRHCGNEVKGFADATTDTGDLADCGKWQHDEADNKRAKKVGWASPDTAHRRDSISNHSSEQNTSFIFKDTSYHCMDNSSGDSVRNVRKTSEQMLFNYRQRFHDYNSQLQNPVILRWCEEILNGVFQEISEELEPSFLLEKMYNLEFKDT